MRDAIQKALRAAAEVKLHIAESQEVQTFIEQVAQAMVQALRHGNKVYFCGNGGSAADAQHLAAELTGRYYKDRPPLPAEALHVNTSFLTAVANDYSYEEVFSRLLQAWGRPGDILWAMSTSGNSPNILRALKVAQEIGMITVGLTGESGGKMVGQCTYLLRVPSRDTPRIQEAHMVVGHTVCQLVEEALFGER